MEMIERIAKKIAEFLPCLGDDGSMCEGDCDCKRVARAAIYEMLNPTEDMVEAGENNPCPHAGCVFTAMIEAALNPERSLEH